MNLLLFFIVCFLFLMSIVLSKYDFAHPSVLFSAVWLVSSFFCILGSKYSYEVIEISTVLYICFFNFIFIFFSNICTIGAKSRYQNFCNNGVKIKFRYLKKKDCNKIFLFCIIFYLFASIYLYKDIVRMANLVATPKNFFDIFRLARYADTEAEFTYSALSTYLFRFNISIGVVCLYFATKNFFISKEKNILFILAFISILFTFFSCARNQAILLISAYLFITIFNFYYCSDKSKFILFRKAFRYFVLGGIICISLFIIIGYFFLDRMKDGSFDGIIESITEYVGGPVYGFNYYLNNQSQYISPYFGAYSLNALNNVLYNLGFIDKLISSITPFMNDNSGLNINVYTMYFRYLVDFGFIGTVFIVIIVALFYGLIYRKCLESESKDYIVPIFSVFMYGVIMSFFEEKIFTFLNWYIIIVLGIILFIYFLKKILLKIKF